MCLHGLCQTWKRNSVLIHISLSCSRFLPASQAIGAGPDPELGLAMWKSNRRSLSWGCPGISPAPRSWGAHPDAGRWVHGSSMLVVQLGFNPSGLTPQAKLKEISARVSEPPYPYQHSGQLWNRLKHRKHRDNVISLLSTSPTPYLWPFNFPKQHKHDGVDRPRASPTAAADQWGRGWYDPAQPGVAQHSLAPQGHPGPSLCQWSYQSCPGISIPTITTPQQGSAQQGEEQVQERRKFLREFSSSRAHGALQPLCVHGAHVGSSWAAGSCQAWALLCPPPCWMLLGSWERLGAGKEAEPPQA